PQAPPPRLRPRDSTSLRFAPAALECPGCESRHRGRGGGRLRSGATKPLRPRRERSIRATELGARSLAPDVADRRRGTTQRYAAAGEVPAIACAIFAETAMSVRVGFQPDDVTKTLPSHA